MGDTEEVPAGAEGGDVQEGEAQAPTDDGAAPAGDQPIEPAIPDPVSAAVAKFHLRISNAFKIFDHDNSNTCDVRELGTVIRSLGCCPSEEELREIILECEEEEATGVIKYERFEPVMARLLQEKRFRSADEELIYRAFKVLDKENKGFLDPNELQTILMENGEGLTAEECEEMMSAAVDPNKNVVTYTEHASLMAVDPAGYY